MNMYSLGEKVIYGVQGVCLVTDLEQRTVDGKQVTYLVLEPSEQSGSRYLVPTHNAAAMAKVRPILSPEDMEAMLSSGRVRTDVWIPEEGKRKQSYKELITSNDREQLAGMVAALYRHRAALTAAGKKIHMSDENFLRDAEKILSGEIAAALNQTPSDALKYLRKKLKEDSNN